MKTRKNRFICFIIFVVGILFASSCSRPMDTPVNGSSIEAFVKSVTGISKKLDADEEEEFHNAIKIIAGDVMKAAGMLMLTGGSSRSIELTTQAVVLFDGKTPREIIAAAKIKKDYIKNELVEAGRDVDDKTVDEIIEMSYEENIKYLPNESSDESETEEPEPPPRKQRKSPSARHQEARDRAMQRVQELQNP